MTTKSHENPAASIYRIGSGGRNPPVMTLKRRPRCKDGSLDMRYKVNWGL